MSELKATPGPWRIYRDSNETNFEIEANANTPYWVGKVQKMPGRVEESEANANLIAAAPDLHAALDGLISARDSVTVGVEKELLKEFLPKARAALAKARGE